RAGESVGAPMPRRQGATRTGEEMASELSNLYGRRCAQQSRGGCPIARRTMRPSLVVAAMSFTLLALPTVAQTTWDLVTSEEDARDIRLARDQHHQPAAGACQKDAEHTVG